MKQALGTYEVNSHRGFRMVDPFYTINQGAKTFFDKKTFQPSILLIFGNAKIFHELPQQPYVGDFYTEADIETAVEAYLETIKVVDPTLEKCSRCQTSYPLGTIKAASGECQFCEASESQSKARKARQSRIDFLITQSAGTPVEDFVLALLQRYSVEVLNYVETGSTDLNDAILAESEAPFTNYLAIELPFQGGVLTVKNSILNRINI